MRDRLLTLDVDPSWNNQGAPWQSTGFKQASHSLAWRREALLLSFAFIFARYFNWPSLIR